MKKAVICLLFTIFVCGNAHAKVIPDIFMTDDYGSYDVRQPKKFLLDETPWMAVDLVDNSTVSGTWWLSSSTKTFDFYSLVQEGLYTSGDFTFYNSYADNRVWVGLTDWLNGVGECGEWHITGAVLLDGVTQDGHSINYSVDVVKAIPEPISTILFITGGATLAIRRLRKGRKA